MRDADGPIVRLATHAMGARFELVLHGADPGHLRAVGEECVREIELWHRRLSAFAPDSDVARINRAGGTPVRVDRELFDLLAACEVLRRESLGLFHVGAGRIMRQAGLHPGEVTGRTGGLVEFELDEASLSVRLTTDGSASAAEADAGAVETSGLDLGGVAKGFVLDRVGDVLREFGVATALVHGGASGVLAIGAPPGSAGWRVLLQSDGEPATVVLRDECLAVTAPRGRTVEGDGGASSHIVDPRTGRPIRVGAGADTAAVIGASAMLCDAWAKPVLMTCGRPGALPGAYTAAVHVVRAGGGRGWSIWGPHAVQHAAATAASRSLTGAGDWEKA